MQDSLGGNAKTLMFVNISPADYNQEETSTALTYATRVKQITNEANKQQVCGANNSGNRGAGCTISGRRNSTVAAVASGSLSVSPALR